MIDALNDLSDDDADALREAWVTDLAAQTRDPRLKTTAMNRTLHLPDDANFSQRSAALIQHAPLGYHLAVLFELEYQKLIAGHEAAAARVPAGDPVMGWLTGRRDAEEALSREWWAIERLRIDYTLRYTSTD